MKCNGKPPRFINKNNNENERKVMESWWIEATNMYGTLISYHSHGYTLTGHDFLYGENPTAEFADAVEMLAIPQMSNDALLLSKFGITSDSDLTLIIPYRTFGEAMGDPRAEPKAGDLIVLTELGWDRPNGGGYPNSYPSTQQTGLSTVAYCQRTQADENDDLTSNTFLSGNGSNPPTEWIRGPNVYEITQRRDENLPQQLNPLLGHYVWLINCKRFDYSYEPKAPIESGHDQVGDNTLYGKLSGGTETPENERKYPQNVLDESRKSWNYSENGNRDSVYGSYD